MEHERVSRQTFDRERRARRAAEQLLEERARELYDVNERLMKLNTSLEQRVEEKTHELLEAVRRARAASEAKSAFLANMSHEIRTPMTAILGYADLLKTDRDLAADPVRAGEAIDALRTNASHLLAVLNDILDISKIEAGQMSIEPRETDPVALVEDVACVATPQAIAKGLAFIVQYETPMPVEVRTDAGRLRQVLLNLVGNAVKFTQQGNVTLYVGCDVESLCLWFRVEDTGIGMSDEQLARVRQFDPFTQADAGTTRRFGGSGLGLSIASQLAMLLGGELLADSTLGVGSTFTVRLAMSSLRGAKMRSLEDITGGACAMIDKKNVAGESCAGPLLDRMRVLLVDDCPDNLRLISHHLRRAGAEVETAANGLEAIECVRATRMIDEPYDVVLMDMQMPELDGYDATRQLQREGVPTPVLALTAHAMRGDRERCLDAGCCDYLTKPIDKRALIEACAKWGTRAAA